MCFRCYTIECCHLPNVSVCSYLFWCFGFVATTPLDGTTYFVSYIKNRLSKLRYSLTELLGVTCSFVVHHVNTCSSYSLWRVSSKLLYRSFCLFVCACNSKTIAPVDLVIYTRSILPVARSCSKMIGIK